jgi:hypothetical protein
MAFNIHRPNLYTHRLNHKVTCHTKKYSLLIWKAITVEVIIGLDNKLKGFNTFIENFYIY